MTIVMSDERGNVIHADREKIEKCKSRIDQVCKGLESFVNAKEGDISMEELMQFNVSQMNITLALMYDFMTEQANKMEDQNE